MHNNDKNRFCRFSVANSKRKTSVLANAEKVQTDETELKNNECYYNSKKLKLNLNYSQNLKKAEFLQAKLFSQQISQSGLKICLLLL